MPLGAVDLPRRVLRYAHIPVGQLKPRWWCFELTCYPHHDLVVMLGALAVHVDSDVVVSLSQGL